MPASDKRSNIRWFGFLQNIPVRTGIYTGVCLSLFFAAWVLVANRAPMLEPRALERNVGAVSLLGVIASIPVIRFYRTPGDLLISGLLGWTLLTISFGLLSLEFTLLDQTYSAFHIFMMGAVVYLLVATVAWIGTIIWKVRGSNISHIHH
jgi:hypothetical protein